MKFNFHDVLAAVNGQPRLGGGASKSRGIEIVALEIVRPHIEYTHMQRPPILTKLLLVQNQQPPIPTKLLLEQHQQPPNPTKLFLHSATSTSAAARSPVEGSDTGSLAPPWGVIWGPF